MKADKVEDLEVYQLAFRLQQQLFELSKSFPRDETYALTDQMRRSSRSVGANTAEAGAKRHYLAHFRSKLTDADGEKDETLHWVRTALACRYIEPEVAQTLTANYRIVGRQLGSMLRNAEAWCQSSADKPTPATAAPQSTGTRSPFSGDR